MSIRAMDWARQQKTGSPTLKAVLRALADYADENGRSWPSQLTLAADTELSERAVREALKTLEERRYLRRIPWRRPDNSRATDTIELALGDDADQTVNARVPAGRAGTPAAQPAPNAGTPTGATFRYPYRQDAPGVPAAPAGLTTFEPPVNHQKVYSAGQASGVGDADWQLSIERLVAVGVDRQAAKRFLGRCLRHLRGKQCNLADAVGAACDANPLEPMVEVERLLKLDEPLKFIQRKGKGDVSRRNFWPDDYAAQFWAAYPRKADKTKAINILKLIYRDDNVPFCDIMDGLNRMAKSGTEKRYIPHPTTFLRNERWSDEWVAQKQTKKIGATADLWAADAAAAHDELIGGGREQGAGNSGRDAWRGNSRQEGDGTDWTVSQPSGSDPRRLPTLRLVGGS